MYDDGRKLSLELEAKAADNRLGTTLVWDTHGSRLLHGVLNAETEFFRILNDPVSGQLKIIQPFFLFQHNFIRHDTSPDRSADYAALFLIPRGTALIL